MPYPFMLWGLFLSALSPAPAQEIPYAVAPWPENDRGNHRAVVRAAAKADAVRAHIPWRRRDRQPEAKDVRVYNSATGQRVMNVFRASVTREYGEIVFQPATAPGEYEVYCLPYNPG
ncbi:MAG: hypothetical protein IT210_22150 [Armatimonadetes bacterium]|nr:hypothetical protein [Armatimonadota bacterium]